MKIIRLLITFAIVVVVGLFVLARRDSAPQQVQERYDAAEQAIQSAKTYKPEGGCMQVITPAVHEATGAKYTFSNGCLPPGWSISKN